MRLKREFSVIIERNADGCYVGTVSEVEGCYTQTKSLDALMKRIREAIEICLEDDQDPTRNEFVGVQRVTVEA
jgi:predicted RNase H-like HicB family nuclease